MWYTLTYREVADFRFPLEMSFISKTAFSCFSGFLSGDLFEREAGCSW